MQLIQHQELASAQSSITFNSIPQIYTDLYLVISVRNSSTTSAVTRMQFNNDTGSNYYSRLVYGNGSSATTYAETSASFYLGDHPQSTWTSDTFGSTALTIQSYAEAVAKSVSCETVAENNATTSWQQLSTHLWSNTSAITTLKVFPLGGNFAAYSSATLWGITKGSDGVTTVS